MLLADSGKSAPEIAKHLKRNIITIRLWLNRYMESGVSGLMNQPPPGRPAQKTPVIEKHLKEMLTKSPQDYGYQESGWQINIFRDWLQRQGMQACDNTIAKVLDKLDYVYKGQTRITGLDEQILALYARGMTTRDIVATFKEMYDADVSHTLISKVTDAVIDEVIAWQSRPLDAVIPLFI